MKKNRNAFFAESNTNLQGYNPMVANAPYPSVNATSSFYAGPSQLPMPGILDYNELSERLAKIERQISRLDHRITALESSGTKTTDDYETNSNNLYII